MVALTAGRNLDLLEQQVRAFRPEYVALPVAGDAVALKNRLGTEAPHILSGHDGLIACAAQSGAQLVVSAIVGAAGLEPTLAAIEAGRNNFV